MKVAFLSFYFDEYCVRLAGALARQADILLLLPDRRAALHLAGKTPGFNLQPFGTARLRRPVKQLRMISRIIQRIREFDPEVIHLQQGHLWFNFALPLLRRYPLVVTIHDLKKHFGDGEAYEPQVLMNFGFHRAAQLIVHSEKLKQAVVDELGVAGERVHFIPLVGLVDKEAEELTEEDDNQVLFFGRIWKYKGLEFLIRAEPFITAQIPDAKIVIAGQGEDFSPYRRMMVHPDNFIVHNEYVSNEKRAQLFRRASLVVLPYIEASQTGVIPLAYAFGKPVVATTVGGLPEMVDPGETGYLVPPRDEHALADAIICLLRDKQLRRRLGSKGKRKIEAESSPEVVAQMTFAVYKCAVGIGEAGSGHP